MGWEFNGMRLHEHYFENLGGKGALNKSGKLGKKLAEEFGIALTEVTNYLAIARREFRRITLSLLRDTTATEADFRREVRSFLR